MKDGEYGALGIETESSGVPRIANRGEEEDEEEEEKKDEGGTKVALKSGESDSSKYRGTYYSRWKPGVCTRKFFSVVSRRRVKSLNSIPATFLTGDLSPLPATDAPSNKLNKIFTVTVTSARARVIVHRR